jgi:hypothetical protein
LVIFKDFSQRPVSLVGERALLGIQLEFLDKLGEFLVSNLGPTLSDLFRLFSPPINEHALQTADYNDWQNYALVFVCLKLTPQPLGRFPDFVGEIVELGLIY